jgi:N utilization substance protein A
MNGELLRLVDAIHRDKDIDKEVLYEGLEQALLTAAKKKYGTIDNMRVRIDRESGEIRAFDGDEKILPIDLGRIAAQTAKQVIIQKIREAEADVLFEEFDKYRHQLLNGQVQRIEGNTIVVNLRKTEGYLPRHEQVRGETYRVGDRIRGFVVEVKKTPQKVKIILSRSHPELIRRLFELEVPEVADELITIRKLVREAGYKTKVAVESMDAKVDAIGACVGVRGSRIRNIIDEIGGEKIDIIRWNDSLEVLLMNSLKPAQVDSITLFPDENRALVIVDEDQLSLAIGRKGQNVRLASKLVGWDIDIMTEDEAQSQGVSFEGSEVPQVEYIEDDRGDVTSLGPSFRGGPVRSPRRRKDAGGNDEDEAPEGAEATADAAPGETETTAEPIPEGAESTPDETTEDTETTAEVDPEATEDATDVTAEDTGTTAEAAPEATEDATDVTTEGTEATAEVTPEATEEDATDVTTEGTEATAEVAAEATETAVDTPPEAMESTSEETEFTPEEIAEATEAAPEGTETIAAPAEEAPTAPEAVTEAETTDEPQIDANDVGEEEKNA